ncbi:VCBS repeat-containing protein [Catalinimonas sp. 4WD22]|uniref:VCBS repeat-containing protein n=1 Tax=Catalinimonas locisalis TaxID=3133978 RepID=UPI003100E02E
MRTCPYISLSFLCLVCLLSGCKQGSHSDNSSQPGFTILTPEETNITFNNQIEDSDTFNLMTYYYLYNGGGVAAGDLNRDGLDDLVFAGNLVPSRLYLNQGNMQFEDITVSSGFEVSEWVMGVSMVDINADGWLDIYLSVGGPDCPQACRNLLYINQGFCEDGQLCFEETAEAYGLAGPSYSVQATFLDYDLDGDLDMFLLTNIVNEVNKSIIIDKSIKVNKGKNIDKLYQNHFDPEKGHPVFTDVSEQTGIIHEGYGLGVAVDDINRDGWPDIYVANDFMDNDYLYINQQDGPDGYPSFEEEADQYLRHQSYNSMGVDIADINNDLLPDIATLDMLPPDNYRQKMMLTSINEDNETKRLQSGYSRQYIRNTLQLHQGKNGFSEIGQLAGIDATDWSWAVLMADFNQDGQKDMFVTNGIVKDMTDLDFVTYRSGQSFFGSNERKEEKIRQLAKQMKGAKTSNYIFLNNKDLTFSDFTEAWGIKTPSFSNGAAYSDLDNDGDLDLVVNNINDPAFVLRNNTSEQTKAPYLKLKLEGKADNPQAIGSRVYLYQGNSSQYVYHSPQKGYLSSVTPTLHFGLADSSRIDSLLIVWPDQKEQILKNITPSQTLHIAYRPNHNAAFLTQGLSSPMRDVSDSYNLSFQHQENLYNDFKSSPLLLRKYSSLGPGIAVGDVNADGREDFFMGGALGQAASFFVQQADQTFIQQPFPFDSLYEDTGCLLFDMDGDGDLDLYVVSGGVEWGAQKEMYQDRIYQNDGKGNFKRLENALPEIRSSGSCVVAADYDQDGDLDLFVGGRVDPARYPNAPQSYLLSNEGGRFKDVTEELLQASGELGMVSAALWTDHNQDGKADLLIASEWQPLQLYLNNGGNFSKVAEEEFSESSGWWNSLYGSDLDQDGDIDYVLGNHGLNSRYKASEIAPMKLYAKDFDRNNEIDPIVTYTEHGTEYPYPPRDALFSQIVAMRKRFGSYDAYAKAPFSQVFTPQELDGAGVWEVDELRNVLLINQGKGNMKHQALPNVLQLSPITGIQQLSSGQGVRLMVTGNFFGAETALGPYDAFNGAVIELEEKEGELRVQTENLSIAGDNRALVAVRIGNQQEGYIVGRNQAGLMLCETTKEEKGALLPLQADDFYAEVRLRNGKRYHQEFYYGAGYLSQSSRNFWVPEQAEEIIIYDFQGNSRKLKTEVFFLSKDSN